MERLPITDADSLWWVFASGLLVVLATTIALYCNYCQWDTPKDLTTISQVAAVYFVAAMGKRIVRLRQRNAREAEADLAARSKT